jgi:hypothetical protein
MGTQWTTRTRAVRTAPGLSDRIKLIYVERPIVFALVVGGFMVGDLGASTTLTPGPVSP